MRWHKKLLKSSAFQNALAKLAATYIRMVDATGRWPIEKNAEAEALVAEGKPFIAIFWHQRLLMMPRPWGETAGHVDGHMLMSNHRDGVLIARIIANFGIHHLAGSTGKGGADALRKGVKLLKKGSYTGVTPDGPRGPRRRVSLGVVQMARLSGVPVVPVCYSCQRRYVARSWDRFIVPKLFSKGRYQWGVPIYVPRNLDEAGMEAKRLEIETILNDQADRLDAEFGHSPIEPEPEAS